MFRSYRCRTCGDVSGVIKPHYHADFRDTCKPCYMEWCDAGFYGLTVTRTGKGQSAWGARVFADPALASGIMPFLWNVDFDRSIRLGYLDYLMRSKVSDLRLQLTYSGNQMAGNVNTETDVTDVIMRFL